MQRVDKKLCKHAPACSCGNKTFKFKEGVTSCMKCGKPVNKEMVRELKK